MYSRFLTLPKRSFFLFGPRGTGKTTWLHTNLEHALVVNLLLSKELISLTRDPDLLRKKVLAISENQWVVIDEIQLLPILLNEVHALLFESNGKRKFALTGSSARKLKKKEVNLLAGRAVTREFFPLTLYEISENKEIKNEDIDNILQFGTLPSIVTTENKSDKIDLLESYVSTYLKEEIQQEAIVRNLGAFSRFLEITAIMNGQILNSSNIATESGVARTTVNGYFSILEDTLLGFRLPSWRPRIKVKEIEHPKFYLFDCGVIRALSNKLYSPIEAVEKGFLFETLVLNELRSFNSYARQGGKFYYWRTTSGTEVDFIWSRGSECIGFEVKSVNRWKSEYSKTLNDLIEQKIIHKGFGIYLGDSELKDGNVRILPVQNFSKKLFNQSII